MRINETRLTIEIDRNLHYAIKRRALEKKLTLKAWLIMIIAKALRDENNEQVL